MRISKIFCILIALLFIVGFAAIGHAEEEGMLSKIKDELIPENVVDEKAVADAESEIESKQEELFGEESENLEAMERTDVVDAESRDDVTLPHSEQHGEEEAEIVLKVEGMTCTGCEKKVKTALMNCLGVQDCEVSHINGDATVKVAKGSANTAEMINAVEKTGFSAELKEEIQYGAEPKTKGMEEKEVAEEEGILSKVKEIFKPETAAEEKE